MQVCPINRSGQECIILGEDNKPIISEELCVSCLLCVKRCPAQCIYVVNLPEELKLSPLHQYGKNQFRLYRLPYPKESSVVGIVGRNGIGKSTALKILSGNLTANLGDFEKEGNIDSVIERYRGKELQGFFEKMKSKGIKISYKPQNISELPKIAKGKVKDLLKKVDERKKLDETVKLLHITPILDRNLKDLSGGELQRVAIAASVLKNADVYALDEPTSFLDIRERLNMANVIRSLADEKKSILVIEHDLAVLDYLSDYVHILFGQQAVYGVVSASKTVRHGINEFLEGYIKDENIRFRGNEIKFEVKPPAETVKRKLLASYPSLEKKFKGFSLSVEKGELKEGEVIGILGPNAIGKTTFVKMLAGVEKPDNGKLDFSLKVSYKPQYIEAEKGITVQELMQKSSIDFDIFKSEVDRRLNISKMNDSLLEQISGGELQKVAVAIALCRDYDLLLLDEPTAFVDAEDRLAIAEAIRSVIDRKGKTALVVDHDILFQDYVSDRLMVFEGSPSKNGKAGKPVSMHSGMNAFLKQLGITFRRDESNGRPRANKPDSQLDKDQKQKGEYYYTF